MALMRFGMQITGAILVVLSPWTGNPLAFLLLAIYIELAAMRVR